MPQNKSKRRKDKSSSHGQHHESPSDSGTLNRKTKSPVRSHVPSKAVSENAVQSVSSSNEPLGMNSEKSNVLNTHSSVCSQENASGTSSSSSCISSSVLQTLLDEKVVMSKFRTQLNERTKCSSCTSPNILIRTDLEECGNFILKLLKENKELKLENMSLKSGDTKLNDVNDISHHLDVKTQQVDDGQGSLKPVVYPDSATVYSMNTIEMEIDEGASGVAVVEPCPSQNDQQDTETWQSTKKGNNRRRVDRKFETKSSASRQRNGSVEVGNDTTLPGNTVDNTPLYVYDNSSWYEEEISVGSQNFTENNGASVGSHDDTEREATADEKREGNPREFRGGNYFRVDVPNEQKGGWRSNQARNRPNQSGDPNEQRGGYRNIPNQSGDRGYPNEQRGGYRNRPNQSGDRGDPNEQRGGYRNRPNRSGDRGGQRDYAAGGRKWGGKSERTYKIVEETFGDLFMAPKEYSLAHCVAEDMRMGSGIAVTFRQMFKNVETLLDQGKKSGQVAVLENEGRFIYYLVTKKVSNGKPRISDLVSSVEEMKQHCVENRVTNIAMPRIGCGLDRLEWSTVKDVLEDKFADTDVHIIVYNFQQESGEPETPVPRSRLYVRQELMHLVSIEANTGLVFLGTEDAHVDETIESLNTKFNFLEDYKRCPKRVGDVVKFERKNEYLYCLIVKKNAKDRFSYLTLNKCLCKLRDLIWKDRYDYFGMEAFIVDDDDLTMEKIITILKNVFFSKKLEAWICWPPHLQEIYKRFNRTNYATSGSVAGN